MERQTWVRALNHCALDGGSAWEVAVHKNGAAIDCYDGRLGLQGAVVINKKLH